MFTARGLLCLERHGRKLVAVVPLIGHLVGHDQMVLGVDRDLYIVADGSGAFAASSHRGCLRRARQFGAGLRVTGTLTCEQSVLLGPVERQIELAQTRRGEFTGLPPLQDRLDQLRAQEGKANQTPDVAPGDVVTLGQFLERSGTTGGELLKPRAPAGDRPDQRRITRDLSICCARPGSTSLVSAPRRLKATAARMS